MGAFAFETVDVFTTERFGGNPLAVFPDARGMDPGVMQRIAREFNLSETTFVLPAREAGHRAEVRIFTPVAELPFAGHPNVGTALVLAWRSGEQPAGMVFEERAGLVPIRFDWTGAHARATLEAPQVLTLGMEIPVSVIAACAGLGDADVLTGLHEPVVAGVGNLFAIAEVRPEALARAMPDTGAMRAALQSYSMGKPGFSLHLHAAVGRGRRTRMFAPLMGIPEDPATGSANVALAALLLSLGREERMEIEIEQGVEMGRPSMLYAGAWRAADGVRAWIGGSAVSVMQGMLTV